MVPLFWSLEKKVETRTVLLDDNIVYKNNICFEHQMAPLTAYKRKRWDGQLETMTVTTAPDMISLDDSEELRAKMPCGHVISTYQFIYNKCTQALPVLYIYLSFIFYLMCHTKDLKRIEICKTQKDIRKFPKCMYNSIKITKN